MSTTSTRAFDFASRTNSTTSPSSSKPISIASTTSSRKSSFSDYSSTTTPLSPFSSCHTRRQSIEKPSAYISDADLIGDDLDEPYLSEPPQAPRSAAYWMARPLLPPVTSPMPHKSKRKGSKPVKFSKTSSSSG